MPKLLNIDLFLKNILVLIFLQFGLSFAYGMESDETGGSASGTVGSAAAPMKEEGENSDEEEGSSSATPKTAAAPPSGRLSPICRSPIPEDPNLPRGCVDPRVYRSTLNIATYNGEEPTPIRGSVADDWHRSKARELMDICRVMGIIRKQRNLALAGIRLIYEYQGIMHSTPILNLDPIFVSGVDSKIMPISESIDTTNELTVNGRTRFLRSISDELEARDIETLQDIAIKNLQKLAEDITTTKLSLNKLNAWKILIFDRPGQIFEKFFHSEQVLKFYLLNKTREICEKIIPLLPGEHAEIRIVQVIYHIATVNGMCRNCAITYFLLSEQRQLQRVFQETLINLFNLRIKEDALSILIEVSGLKNFDLPAEAHLNKLLEKSSLSIDAFKFSPHIAHHWLNPNISYLNTQELGVYSPRHGEHYILFEGERHLF